MALKNFETGSKHIFLDAATLTKIVEKYLFFFLNAAAARNINCAQFSLFEPFHIPDPDIKNKTWDRFETMAGRLLVHEKYPYYRKINCPALDEIVVYLENIQWFYFTGFPNKTDISSDILRLCRLF